MIILCELKIGLKNVNQFQFYTSFKYCCDGYFCKNFCHWFCFVKNNEMIWSVAIYKHLSHALPSLRYSIAMWEKNNADMKTNRPWDFSTVKNCMGPSIIHKNSGRETTSSLFCLSLCCKGIKCYDCFNVLFVHLCTQDFLQRIYFPTSSSIQLLSWLLSNIYIF